MATITWHVSHERLLHFGLWAAQLLLASIFASMAVLKLLLHTERLIEVIGFAAAIPVPLVRALGALELLGAIAVSAPAVTRTPQRIVGGAAVGFVALMGAAALFHVARGELRMVAVNVAIGLLAAFVAWGRLAHRPLEGLEQT